MSGHGKTICKECGGSIPIDYKTCSDCAGKIGDNVCDGKSLCHSCVYPETLEYFNETGGDSMITKCTNVHMVSFWEINKKTVSLMMDCPRYEKDK